MVTFAAARTLRPLLLRLWLPFPWRNPRPDRGPVDPHRPLTRVVGVPFGWRDTEHHEPIHAAGVGAVPPGELNSVRAAAGGPLLGQVRDELLRGRAAVGTRRG